MTAAGRRYVDVSVPDAYAGRCSLDWVSVPYATPSSDLALLVGSLTVTLAVTAAPAAPSAPALLGRGDDQPRGG